MVLKIGNGFQVTLLDRLKCLVVVENLVKGIRYEFPDEFEHIKSAQVYDNYLLIIESNDGRKKMIQLLG